MKNGEGKKSIGGGIKKNGSRSKNAPSIREKKRVAVLMNGNEQKAGQMGEKRERAYSYGGVLGGREQRLAVLAELAVQHCPGVSQQRGQDLPRGHLQNLAERERRLTREDVKHPCVLTSLLIAIILPAEISSKHNVDNKVTTTVRVQNLRVEKFFKASVKK